MKMRDMKLTDYTAEHENAGHENARQKLHFMYSKQS